MTASSSLASTINWDTLTLQALWTLRNLAVPISNGYSEAEVANHHGVTAKWVRARMLKLRNELEA